MTTCISPLYNDNSEQINLQAMYEYYDSLKPRTVCTIRAIWSLAPKIGSI